MTPRLFLDLDGVLADFDGGFPRIFGVDRTELRRVASRRRRRDQAHHVPHDARGTRADLRADGYVAPEGCSMKALSIRQPWAHLILHGGKDIENRSWSTRLRGRVLVHASSGMTLGEWNEAYRFVADRFGLTAARAIPLPFEIQRGGLVGSVEIIDCTRETSSQWFVGSFGFVLRDPRQMPFVRCTGALGFFNVPDYREAA